MERQRATISDLPVEVMTKIFEKLKSPEIFNVAEVSKHWYAITQTASIVNKTIVRFGGYNPRKNRPRVKFNSEIIDLCLSSSRKFQFELEIYEELPENYLQFVDKFSDNIIKIKLYKIHLTNLDQLNITSLTNLKHFELELCHIPSSLKNFITNIVKSLEKLIFSQCNFENESILPDDLHLNVKSLDLCCGMEKFDAHSLLSSIPNLETLSMMIMDSNCQETVFKYLKNKKLTKSLTKLDLSNDFVENNIRDIEQINHLNLKHFSCGILSARQVDTFLCSQLNLTDLHLNDLVLNNKLLQTIFKNLLNLRVLHLSALTGCEITDFGITGQPNGYPMSRLEKLTNFWLDYHSDYPEVFKMNNASIRHIESMKHLKYVTVPWPENYTSNNPGYTFM